MRVLRSLLFAFCTAVTCGGVVSAWAADEPVPPPPGQQEKKEQPADRDRPKPEPAADNPSRDRNDKDATPSEPRRDDKDKPPRDAPRADAPRSDTPPAEAPRSDAPRTDAPRSDAPRSDVPRSDAPRPDAPRTELPRGDVPRTDLPRADAPRTGTDSAGAAARGRFDLGFTLDRQSTQRAIVADIPANSLVARAGLRRGDIITAVGNVNVANFNDVSVLIERFSGRGAVPITVLRDGRPVTLEVTYAAPAAPPAMAETPRPLPGGNYLGLQAATVMLITDVTPDGLAAQAGLKPGDLIQSVNGARVESFTQFTRAVSDAPAGELLTVVIERSGKPFSVQMPASGTRHETLRPAEPARTVSPPATVPAPPPATPQPGTVPPGTQPPVVTPPITVPPATVPDDDRGRPGRPRVLPGRR